VLEKSTTSCFLVKIGRTEELPPIFEGGFGILRGFMSDFVTLRSSGKERES
jgi:hypothetical protein